MMLIELDKEDLISLCKGKEPSYNQMENQLVKANGRYNGSYGTWSWNYDAFKTCTEQELIEVYDFLKNSKESFKQKAKELEKHRVIQELRETIKLGIKQGNIAMVKSCQNEIKRLEYEE
jgi:hypothetical protein